MPIEMIAGRPIDIFDRFSFRFGQQERPALHMETGFGRTAGTDPHQQGFAGCVFGFIGIYIISPRIRPGLPNTAAKIQYRVAGIVIVDAHATPQHMRLALAIGIADPNVALRQSIVLKVIVARHGGVNHHGAFQARGFFADEFVFHNHPAG